MAVTIYFGTVSKRKNSTYQPTLTASYDCIYKEETSVDRPTFIIQDASFSTAYNYAKWGDNYYFIDDIVSLSLDMWQVSCALDVLATYKTDIIGSTQYVCYSSNSGGSWLPDTRIPVLKDCAVSKNTASLGLFSGTGFYVLAAVGDTGCTVWGVGSRGALAQLVQNISTWQSNDIASANNLLPSTTPGTDETSAINNLQVMVKAVSEASTQTGFLGNAFQNAPQCIRSCIWVPFLMTDFIDGGASSIHLGNYDTGVSGYPIVGYAVKNSVTVNIPWQYNDWRRGVCEELYLYLPLVGMVGISADSITQETSLTIKWSATASDGCICYEVVTNHGQIIGTYGASCSANYPIGINQQASAGEVFTALLNGTQKTVATAVNSSVSPISAVAAVAGVGLDVIATAYDAANTTVSTHVSSIGGIGGGAGIGLDNDVAIYSVAHSTATTPASMQATMGLPTMKPMSLSTLTGYCQCANAHVAAPAQSSELDAIDTYLNSGFYIE